MKRLITIISALSITLISCQQNLVPDQPEGAGLAEEIITKSFSTGKVGPDDPIVFLTDADSLFWTQVVTLEDRFVAFNVPATTLRKMTTAALVKSIMNYPLNYLVLFYSNPQTAVNLIIKNSPLHQELISRSDVVEVFVDIYTDTEIDISLDKSNYDRDYARLSLTNMLFVEYFLGLEVLNTFCSSSVKEKLTHAVSENLQQRLNDPENFDAFTIEPLIIIDDMMSLGIIPSERTEWKNRFPSTPIKTVLGQTLRARFSYEEMPTSMIVSETNNAITAHPNAILRGSATQFYNSHSYAWYKQSVLNNRWIHSSDFTYETGVDEFQLHKFWTNDLYVACSPEDAEIVYFPDTDHSAVKLPNGKYISKWSLGPLMEHDLEDCPYYSTNIQYYKIRETPLVGRFNISGQSPVRINQSYSYNIQEDIPLLSFEWEVRFMDAPSPTPFTLTDNFSSCVLVCQDYGLFKTSVYGYYNGRIVATGQKDVIALPDEYVTQ